MDPIANKKEFEDLTTNLRDLAYAYIEKYNPSKQQTKTYLLKKYLNKFQGSRTKKEITENIGNIDILVNNVGGSINREGIEGTPIDDLNKTFDLNLNPSIKLMQLVIPHMKSQKWGRIVNISSVYGRELGGNLSYMTAKAALNSITKHSAIDLAKYGILINAVAPGPVSHKDGSWEKFQKNNSKEVVENFIKNNLPIGRFGWPEPVGDLVAFLSSENAGFITGTCINIDGGWSKSIS